LVWAFFQALPLALLAVYFLPALAFVCGAIGWELARVMAMRVKERRNRGGSNAVA